MSPDRMDEAIAIARDKLLSAADGLGKLLKSNCPGPHRVRGHRDGNPAWCNACGYTDTGKKIKEVAR